jgi:hypothetical protein
LKRSTTDGNNISIVSMLMKAGANMQAATHDDVTALKVAVHLRNYAMLSTLLAAGAKYVMGFK